MINTQPVTSDIFWVGGSDRRIALFENLYPLTDGVSYNSYLVIDEKTVLFDTVDSGVSEQFLENLLAGLGSRSLDYLVILHMEPDHCSLLQQVVKLFPEVTLVGSAKALTLLGQFFPRLSSASSLTVKEGDILDSGRHQFRFIAAPMVHWPEVMMAYDPQDKILFSADAFGTFGAMSGSIFNDSGDYSSGTVSECRRYYSNIVGKYGMQVQAVLKKCASLDIRMICSLHGPVWRSGIEELLALYHKWSTYEAEEPDSTLILYGSMYGHTASAAQAAAGMISEKTGRSVIIHDISKTHSSYLISEIWKCGRILFFCPTYNNGIYSPVRSLLDDMAALGVQNRKIAIVQNGSWAPASGKLIRAHLEQMKNMQILDEIFTIKSALHEADRPLLAEFIDKVIAQ